MLFQKQIFHQSACLILSRGGRLIVSVDEVTIVWNTYSERFAVPLEFQYESTSVTPDDVRSGIGILVGFLLKKAKRKIGKIHQAYPTATVEFWAGKS